MVLNLEKLYEKYNLKINGVLHIGAHHGQEYEAYIKNNINNCIFFEPSKNSFNILKGKFSDKSNVVLINKALGNYCDDIEMYIETANHGQSSSLLKPKIHI